MKSFLLLVVFAVVVAGCQNGETDDSKDNTIPPQDDVVLESECTTDSDCAVAGCSGQVCTTAEKAPGILTTCEYKEEYICLELTRCACFKESCEWVPNDEFVSCLEQYG